MSKEKDHQLALREVGRSLLSPPPDWLRANERIETCWTVDDATDSWRLEVIVYGEGLHRWRIATRLISGAQVRKVALRGALGELYELVAEQLRSALAELRPTNDATLTALAHDVVRLPEEEAHGARDVLVDALLAAGILVHRSSSVFRGRVDERTDEQRAAAERYRLACEANAWAVERLRRAGLESRR